MIEEKECLSRRGGGGGGGLATEMDEGLDLPPGFRFHPTDEELITYYLIPKILNDCFCARAIGEADLNKCEPWDLPRRAKMGEKESYFFCVRDRKYPTGSRTNRATDAGYWKATGKDREVQRLKKVVGMKKTLVFYRGRAPKGQKTNWVMHEFRLEESYSKHNLLNTEKDDWVICRVIQKKPDGTRADLSAGSERLSSYGNGLGASPLILPPLVDSSPVASWPNQLNNPTVLQGTMSRHETLLSAPSSSSNPSLFPARASLACPDAVSMKEHSILRMLIENDDATYLKTEAFLGADFSRDLLLPAMDQGRMHMPFEHPLSAHGQGDVDWFGVIEAGDTA